MRRVTGLVLPALLALAVLAAPAVALAASQEAVGLAVEGTDQGPDPMPREAEENPARELGGYDDLDVPFTWGAAFLMLFLGVMGIVLMGGLYWLLVHRPSQREAERTR